MLDYGSVYLLILMIGLVYRIGKVESVLKTSLFLDMGPMPVSSTLMIWLIDRLPKDGRQYSTLLDLCR